MNEPNKLVIEKLKKLIALSESPNENEAASALAKTYILLAKHGLSISDLEIKDENIVEKGILNKKRLRSWESALISAIISATYTEALHMPGEGKVSIVGREVNIIAAENLFDYLHKSIIRISKKYKGVVRHSDSFRMGMVVNISERLNKLKEDLSPLKEERQMVVSMKKQADKENREFLNNNYGKLNKKRVNNNVEPNSYGLGQKIGHKVSLNIQIDNS